MDSAGRNGREALVAGFSVAVLLALRTPGDVGPRDTGELSAAAWVLGVSHPTGAPLSMTLQTLFSYLPFGSIVARQGILMAICLGFAVGLAAHVAGAGRNRTGRTVAAIVVASVALAPTMLRAGTMTEVYASSLALVAAAWAASHLRSPRGLALLGALCALGAASHVTARVLVPIAALPALIAVARTSGRKRALVPFALGVVAFLPLVLHVPVAASRNPPLSWGAPRTFSMFVRHFMASDIRQTFAERTSTAHLSTDLRALFDITLLDLGVPLLLLGIGGALMVARRKRNDGLEPLHIVAICGAVDLFFAARIHPMGVIDRQVGHAALLAFATLAAALVAELAERYGTVVSAVVALGAVAGAVPRFRMEARGDEGRFVPEVWTIPGALARVPPRAIVVCDTDDSCGGAMYAQMVEGARPDVDVLPRPFAKNAALLGKRFVASASALEASLASDDRPILVQGGGDHPYPFPTTIDRALPWIRRETRGVPRVPYAPAARFEALDDALCGPARDRCGPLTRGLLAQAHLGPMGPTLRDGRFADAEKLGDLGLSLDPTIPSLWNNRAVVRATLGRFEEALADAKRALELDPARAAAATNAITYAAKLDRIDEARNVQRAFATRCKDCLNARILGAALEGRETGRHETLDALEAEASSKGRKDAWCRAYDVAKLPSPRACR